MVSTQDIVGLIVGLAPLYCGCIFSAYCLILRHRQSKRLRYAPEQVAPQEEKKESEEDKRRREAAREVRLKRKSQDNGAQKKKSVVFAEGDADNRVAPVQENEEMQVSDVP